MSTISLTHEGNISIEHLASMSTTALVVDMMVTAKRSARVENAKRDHRRSERAIHRGGACKERWCCPKGTKPQRPTNHELSLVALWADFEPHMEDGPIYGAAGVDSLDGAAMRCYDEDNFDFRAGAYRLVEEPLFFDYNVSDTDIRWAQRNALEEGRWTPEFVETTTPVGEPLPWVRRAAQRKAAEQRRAAERLEANRQHWAKVYQRPEAEQAAKRSLSTNAVLSTATK